MSSASDDPKSRVSTSVLLAGAIASSGALHWAFRGDTSERYPLPEEYSLVRSCVDSSRERISFDEYQIKQNVCLCATEKTISSISYKKYQASKSVFLEEMKKNTNTCLKNGRG